LVRVGKPWLTPTTPARKVRATPLVGVY